MSYLAYFVGGPADLTKMALVEAKDVYLVPHSPSWPPVREETGAKSVPYKVARYRRWLPALTPNVVIYEYVGEDR